MKPIEFTAKIEEIKDYFFGQTLHCRNLKLRVPKGINLEFNSGQFLMLAHEEIKHPANPELLKWGAMSIVSTQKELPIMELSIRINEHPGLTNLIGKLKKDDELKVKAPFGMFVLREEDKKRIFVATGTGLAPMISYLRAMKGKFIPTTLFFGCHSETTFFFQEE